MDLLSGRVRVAMQCNAFESGFYCDGQFRTNVPLSRHFVSFHFFILFFFVLVIVMNWLGCYFLLLFAHIQSLGDYKCQSMNTNYAFWYVYFWISHAKWAMCGRFLLLMLFSFSLFITFSFVHFCRFVPSSSSFAVQLIIDILSNVSKHRPDIFLPHQSRTASHRNPNKKVPANAIFRELRMNVREMGRAHRFPLSRHSSSLRPADDTLSTCYSTHTHTPRAHCHTASLSRSFLRPRLSYYWHARSRNINYVITTATTTTTAAEAAPFSVSASNRKTR